MNRVSHDRSVLFPMSFTPWQRMVLVRRQTDWFRQCHGIKHGINFDVVTLMRVNKGTLAHVWIMNCSHADMLFHTSIFHLNHTLLYFAYFLTVNPYKHTDNSGGIMPGKFYNTDLYLYFPSVYVHNMIRYSMKPTFFFSQIRVCPLLLPFIVFVGIDVRISFCHDSWLWIFCWQIEIFNF